MNRFFSKLDLRDIKIKPEGSHYPPDAEEDVPEEDAPSEPVATAPPEEHREPGPARWSPPTEVAPIVGSVEGTSRNEPESAIETGSERQDD